MSKPICPPVKSSTIAGYLVQDLCLADQTCSLIVEFKHGGTYRYAKVKSDLVQRMADAESVGSFFAAEIKSKHDVTRWNDQAEAFLPIERKRASTASKELLFRMLEREHLATRKGQEYVGAGMFAVVRATGREAPAAGTVTVATFVNDLWQDEASAAIDYLKAGQ